MKRLPALRAAIRASAPATPGILTVLATATTLAILAALTGCAGAPETPGGALSLEAVAEALDDARGLLVRATPDSLEAVAARMSRAGLQQPQSGELASLAGALYRLLYPEVDVPPSFPPQGAYSGPYQPALAEAGRGLPPPAGWAPPAEDQRFAASEQAGAGAGRRARAAARRAAREGAKPSGAAEAKVPGPESRLAGFLNRVVPALYLARVEPPPGAAAGSLAGAAGSDSRTGLEAQLDADLEAGLEQARTDTPSSVLPPYLMGRAADLAGRPEEAEGLYRTCLSLSDSFYPARQRLAALYLADGRSARAAGQLEVLHAELPGDAAVRDSLIQAQLLAGEPERASALVAEALIDEPDSARYLLLRAQILLARGEWTRALKPLALLQLRHPEAREGYLLSARIYYEQAGDQERALEVIREAEQRFPQDPRFPELAGTMLLAESRSDEGLEHLRRALELEPGRLSTLRVLAAEAVRRHRWVQAGRTLEEILAREETAEDLRDAYTTATHLGDRELALDYARRLYRLDQDDQARLRYAEALLAAGRVDDARGFLEGAVPEQYGTRELRSLLLYLQARLREEEEPAGGLALLQRAVAEDPDNERAVRRLAELYQRRGQLRQARLFLRAAVELEPEDAGLALQLQEVERALAESGNELPGATP